MCNTKEACESFQNSIEGSPVVKIVKLNPAIPTPEYQTEGAACFDVVANLTHDIIIQPCGYSEIIPTGLKMQIPPGYEAQVRPRSGLAANDDMTILNSPGTIDCDYRGEVKVILVNHGDDNFTVLPGMRIAQIAICPIEQAIFQVVDELDETKRGSGGFGHTGI